MLIGLCGYARVGKNAVGDILSERHGFEQRSFADPLKQLALEINPVIGNLGGKLRPMVEHSGWDVVKEHVPESRVFLQRLGTGVRKIDPDFWIRPAFKGLMPRTADYVFTDCRFPNEAREIRYNGGKLVRIERPGYGPVNGHESEVAIDDENYDAYLKNDGTIEDLAVQVGLLLADWS